MKDPISGQGKVNWHDSVAWVDEIIGRLCVRNMSIIDLSFLSCYLRSTTPRTDGNRDGSFTFRVKKKCPEEDGRFNAAG